MPGSGTSPGALGMRGGAGGQGREEDFMPGDFNSYRDQSMRMMMMAGGGGQGAGMEGPAGMGMSGGGSDVEARSLFRTDFDVQFVWKKPAKVEPAPGAPADGSAAANPATPPPAETPATNTPPAK